MRRILFVASVVVLMAGIPLHGATKSAPSEAVSTLPDEDPDGDGLINQQEAERGTMPNNPDTDGDTIEDGFDAVPKNRAMTVLATPENSYAIVDLGSEHFPGGINDNPDVLLLRPGSGNTRQEGALWSKGVLTGIGEGEEGSFRGPLLSRAVFFGSPGEITETNPG